MEVLIQDLKALPNITSQCEAKVLHMRHTSSQEYLGIYSKCTFLFCIEKGTQIQGGLLVQDWKALPDVSSQCEARMLHMRHTSSHKYLGIHSKYTLLAFI